MTAMHSDGQGGVAGAYVDAPINFLQPMAERPYFHLYEPPPGVPLRTDIYEPYPVRIANARPEAAELSLDHEGFELVEKPSSCTDFFNGDAVKAIYYPEVEQLLRAHTGATFALVFDHNVRSAPRVAAGQSGVMGPVDRAHSDFTTLSGVERARAELARHGHDANAMLRRRFAIINVWRPVGRPVEKHPLALCDARSVADKDLVVLELRYRERTGEIYVMHHDPVQRWFWFPRLTPQEAILFKGYDSNAQVARYVGHTAFEDPASPPDAPERESIEARALVVYPE